MPSSLRFKFVEIAGNRLTVSLFRQLPVVPLCDEGGTQDASLELLGTVRYKQDKVTLWALALREDMPVRCPLSTELRTRSELEASLATWRQIAASEYNRTKGEGTTADSMVLSYERAIAAEPERHAAHSRAAKLEQLFL